jgi:hypothetical protein
MKAGPGSFKRLLGADTDELTRIHTQQRIENCGDQRTQLLQPIGARQHHNDRNSRSRDILLEWKVLIDGQKCLKTLCQHQPEKFAVALTRPSLLDNRAHGVPRQLALEWTGHTFVKQEPHEFPSSHARAPTPRRPARE